VNGEEADEFAGRAISGTGFPRSRLDSRIHGGADAVRDRYDLDTLRTVAHTTAPCPAWLKPAWLDWLGPDRVLELYASTEASVVFVATGRDWLERPGTVGLPRRGEVQVRTPKGQVLQAGEFGKIWVRRPTGLGPSSRYLGANAEVDSEGWESLGDMGRLDADGYLFVEDREVDMILVGGNNVYPAERAQRARPSAPGALQAAALLRVRRLDPSRRCWKSSTVAAARRKNQRHSGCRVNAKNEMKSWVSSTVHRRTG
jgi:acyl-CoA synthetase (AMP-forming)/AMP-acid ligase II